MKKYILIFSLIAGLLCGQNLVWAGEKEEFEKDLQIFGLQAQAIDLQKRLLIKDMAEWQKLEAQLKELNTQLQVFQEQIGSKGYTINKDGKIVEKPKPQPPQLKGGGPSKDEKK